MIVSSENIFDLQTTKWPFKRLSREFPMLAGHSFVRLSLSTTQTSPHEEGHEIAPNGSHASPLNLDILPSIRSLWMILPYRLLSHLPSQPRMTRGDPESAIEGFSRNFGDRLPLRASCGRLSCSGSGLPGSFLTCRHTHSLGATAKMTLTGFSILLHPRKSPTTFCCAR
ncbi:unnamed protein product [Cyclocybe aegerita]|uniref:Uncharacterized protein n=1 Tax=Cyclocybe aegerita TaxID=1973307 RepID=A0A8S0WNX3_CYCAE|nr:unnamed protein product [Cyclocybe aegerita]